MRLGLACTIVSMYCAISSSSRAAVPTTIADDLSNPSTLRAYAGNLYFVDHSPDDGVMKRVPLSGGAVDTLISGAVLFDSGQNRGIGNFAVGSDGFYGDYGGYVSLRVFHAPLTGGPAETLASPSSGAAFLAVDAANVYFMDAFQNINSVPKAGGDPVQLTAAAGFVRSSRFDSNAIYYVGYSDNRVRRFDLASNEVQVLTSVPATSEGLVTIDDDYVYQTYDGLVRRVAKGGGPTEPIVLDAPAKFAVSDDSSLFFYDSLSATLRSAPRGGGVSSLLADLSGQDLETLIYHDGSLFWTDVSGGIGAARILTIAVPEPSFGMLGLACVAIVVRHRRRKTSRV